MGQSAAIVQRRPRSGAQRLTAALGGISFLRVGISLRMLGYAPLHGFAGFSIRGALGDACALADGRLPPEDARPGGLLAQVFLPAPTPPGTNAQPPPPFVVIPPDRPLRGLRAGERLDFELLLFGGAVEAALEIPLAIQRLGMTRGLTGKAAPFEVAGARILAPGRDIPLWGAGRTRLIDGIRGAWRFRGDELASQGRDASPTDRVARVGLTFGIPLSLREREDGRRGLPRRPTMEHLIGSLWRAADAYGHHYGEGGCDIPLEGLRARAQRVTLERQDVRRVRLRRRSSRGDTPGGKAIDIDGYVGRLSYRGSMGSLLPLLTLGEALGVGRGRCMGLGRYGLGG